MVGRRRKSSRALAASPQRSWIWGRHAVRETLAAARWRPLEVRLADRLDASVRSEVEHLCEAWEVPVSESPAEQLTRWCNTGEHQGLLALMPPYPYVSLEQALETARTPGLFLVLDRIQDPHNFGALLRSAEVFGVDAVFIGERSQCDVTPHVARSSAGAVNHLNICRVTSLLELPVVLREKLQAQSFAATGSAEQTIQQTDLRGPCALVIGNEGEGIAPELIAACDGSVRIAQAGRVESLNAAVAAGVLLYEVRRQRDG